MRWWLVTAIVAAVAYALLASFTRPFTLPADIVTAVPLVAGAVAVGWRIRQTARVGTPEAVGAGAASTNLGKTAWPAEWGRRWIAWVIVSVAAGCWELYCYVSSPRSAHPTFSSLLDTVDATRPGKIVVFALWLALGWFLAR